MTHWDFSEADLRDRFVCSVDNTQNVFICEEVPVFCRSVDLVIQNMSTKDITAIEFKLHDWKRAILQTQSVGLCFDYLCICLPKPKTESGLKSIVDACRENGVGLFVYDSVNDNFEKALDGCKTTLIWDKQKKRVVDYLEERLHESAFKDTTV